MRDRDWFLVGCRLFGVWVAFVAMSYFASYLDARLGPAEDWARSSKPSHFLIHGIAYTVFAFYLLFGTRHLARLCCDGDAPSKADDRLAGPSEG